VDDAGRVGVDDAGSVPVGSIDCVGVVTGVVTDGVLGLSGGFITKMASTVTSATAAPAPIAFNSSDRGRVGFQAAPVVRRAGFRRFVTSSESYR
jgi:hypothetical protein